MPDFMPHAGGKPVYLALDQGSHASRALLFDDQGRIRAEGWRPIETRRPAEGYVEYDAAALLESLRGAIADALPELGEGVRVAAAGLATQRSTVVCWDRHSGVPLTPAISWQDRRNVAMTDSLAEHEPLVRRLTGLPLSPHYGASKLRWCLDASPAVRAKLQQDRLAFGPLASYLLYGLLEERPLSCDPANAARTLLWDLEQRDWSDGLLSLFDLPRQALPRSVATRGGYGKLLVGRRPVPLVVCTGDQSAVPFAFGWPEGDTVFINAGTGAFVQRCTGNRRVNDTRLLTGIIYADASRSEYTLEGTVNGAGSALSEMAEQLQLDEQQALAVIELQQESLPLFLNGIGGLGSPWWRPRFESRWVGEGDAQQRFQSVFESVLFLIRANLEALAELSGAIRRIVLTGGIAENALFVRGLAALTDCPVWVPADTEATARGVAFLIAPEHMVAGVLHETRPDRMPALLARYARWKALMDEAV